MSQHYAPLEASLQHEYGLHLGHAIWRDGISARRLLALVSGLPPGSALHRAVEPKAWAWGNKEELLATLCELLDRHDRHYIGAHTKDGRVPDSALEINRPYDRPRPKGSTLNDLAALMSGGLGKVVYSGA